MNQAIDDYLTKRIGRVHLRQRLGLEAEYEAKVFRKGTHFFHLENWYSVHSFIRNSLRLVGLHGRGRRNTLRIRLREHEVKLPGLPAAFDGYTLLHISDLHVDMNREIVHALIERVRAVDYDLCALTGDYRYRTFGQFEPALAAMARLRDHLKDPVYAVLGNHDTIRMVPGLETMGSTYCSTNRWHWNETARPFTSLVSMMRITIRSTTSRRQRTTSRTRRSPFCCPIRPRRTATPRTPASVSCCAVIPTVARSACQGVFPSSPTPTVRARSWRDRGCITA